MMREGEPTRIMLGVNVSTLKGYPYASISCTRAFEWTLQKIVRSKTSAFKLLFLYVHVPDEDSFDDMDSIYASPEDFKSMMSRDRVMGLHLLQYFVTRCHEIRVSCVAWIKTGDPKKVICHEVKRVRPDFLVLGNRGLGLFQRIFIRTVSDFCVKHAECPVITIKRRADEIPEDPADD
ncbi:hypothetical protein F2P56_021372 [Juglans regia]|uniref:UspA domain-containing protein n=2 Tax=Juglans regia TaxID=51240 RepID=A0A833UN98_JUGRE|nr:universal stress protein A-like protein [Juglans regia]KAF5457258.1 hypothetical protein F2P56_021372 [Juglans regia]